MEVNILPMTLHFLWQNISTYIDNTIEKIFQNFKLQHITTILNVDFQISLVSKTTNKYFTILNTQIHKVCRKNVLPFDMTQFKSVVRCQLNLAAHGKNMNIFCCKCKLVLSTMSLKYIIMSLTIVVQWGGTISVSLCLNLHNI